MNVLAALNKNEINYIGKIEEVLSGSRFNLEVLEFNGRVSVECSQQKEIASRLAGVDVLVYFGSAENENNKCIDYALSEAARINVKVICIWLDQNASLSAGFENLGDVLIRDLANLPNAITQTHQDWQNGDGSLRDDRPFKRYKCGNKK